MILLWRSGTMRVALLGGGTIARLVLEHVRRASRASRSSRSPGAARRRAARALAREFGVKYVDGREALLAAQPAGGASRRLRTRRCASISCRCSTPASAWSCCPPARWPTTRCARPPKRRRARSGALLYVPSGGIGGLDALKTACLAGVDEVSIQVAKPPAAWKGIRLRRETRRRARRLDGAARPCSRARRAKACRTFRRT